ncbi:MAG: GNAT family N-acetyltransferase [Myxococcota bacterium]
MLRAPAEMGPWVAALEALADGAAEPNVFHEHWFMRAAWETLGDATVSLVLVQAAGASGPSHPLWAAFPVDVIRAHPAIPAPAVRIWEHRYAFLSTPLVRPGYAHAALKALCDWIRAEVGPRAALRLDTISGGGAIHGAVEALSQPRWLAGGYSRPMYRRAPVPVEPGLGRLVSRGRRHELRRQRRRLGERGELTVTHLSAACDAAAFAEEFLALEASGWKGRSGTAMASDPASARFFRTVAVAAHARGRLRGTSMRLDGRAIAQSVDFLTRDGGFAFKTAYDEAWRKYSTGVLLEVEGLLDMQARPEIAWMDSCATPDHPMIGQLWAGRRPIAHMLVGTGAPASNWLVSSMPALRWVKHRLRR